MRRKDGNYIWVESSVKTIKNADDLINKFICVTRDISSRKEIEQKLQISKARFKAIFDIGNKENINSLILHADRAMYKAKSNCKNRVCGECKDRKSM